MARHSLKAFYTLTCFMAVGSQPSLADVINDTRIRANTGILLSNTVTHPSSAAQSFENHQTEWMPGARNHVGAHSSVDLSPAVFKLRTFASGFAAGSVHLEMNEVLTLTNPDLTSPMFAPLTMYYSLQGIFNPDVPSPGNQVNMALSATVALQTPVFANASTFTYIYDEVTGPIGSTFTWVHRPAGTVEIVTDATNELNLILSATIPVFGDYDESAGEWVSEPVDFRAILQGSVAVRGGGGGTVDFSHTGLLSALVPAGFSLESPNGFLSASPQPDAVPEPWLTPVVGIGLAALVVLRRRSA